MWAQNYKTGSSNIILGDYPDPDVIRVDDTYYMVSTTMHFMPGCVILRSYNLLDWEICSYVYDQLEVTDGQTLKDNKGIYGRGMWAACLRYHNGLFYVTFVANDTHKSYLYTAEKIEGPWKKSHISGFYHDMSVLFDDDGKVYVVSGNMVINLVEMEADLSGPKKGGINKVIIRDDPEKAGLGFEGSHFYKINGKYYIFMIHIPKGKMRTEACFVADKVDGPYVGGDVLCSDLGGWNSGVAQGGIVQQNDGKWFGILFQDHGALGRIPVLVPVNFEEEMPVFGERSENGDWGVPGEVTVLDNRPGYVYEPLFGNGFCDGEGKLKGVWQWNHIHDEKLAWVENDVFRIRTDKVVKNVVQAGNTLTQRTFGEKCLGRISLDASKINDGDFAGFCALEGEYAFIGITKKEGKFKLVTAEHKIPYTPWAMGVYDDEEPRILEEIELDEPVVKLQLKFNLLHNKENVQLMYFNEKIGAYERVGMASKLRYTLDQFVGVRFACFMYSTKVAGGEAEFSEFEYDFW
ncbi:MAG: glycoside hydrolase 43 family protein [Treponema sp.]|nr:glycoside hydrolase 43 family protein [Treponema sp.]